MTTIGSAYYVTMADTARPNRDTITVFKDGMRQTLEAPGPIRYLRECPGLHVEPEGRKTKWPRFRIVASVTVVSLVVSFLWIVS